MFLIYDTTTTTKTKLHQNYKVDPSGVRAPLPKNFITFNFNQCKWVEVRKLSMLGNEV